MTKTPEIRHYGVIRNGQKIYYFPELYKMQLVSLNDKEFEEILKEKFVKTSAGTHGYYRGGIIATCLTTEKFAYWEEDEIHDFFCNKFLKRVIEKVWPDGSREEVIHIESTGSLNQKEMNEFIDKVKHWCFHENIQLLSAEEYRLNKYRIIKS